MSREAMAVRRIVTNIHAPNPEDARAFYEQVLGLEVAMDHGWIMTFAAEETSMVQLNVASDGGSGAPVPDLSIEVDDIDDTYQRARDGGFEIVYDLTNEPWGVRRFFLRDPFGKLVNVLAHLG